MNQLFKISLLILFISCLWSCSKKEETIIPEPEDKSLLVGRWEYNQSILSNGRVFLPEFDGVEYEFLKDRTYKKYKNKIEVASGKFENIPISGTATGLKLSSTGENFIYYITYNYRNTYYQLIFYRTTDPQSIDITTLTDNYTRPK